MSDIESEYQSVLKYLYGFVDFSMQRNFRYAPDQFDLGRMFRLAARLGDPQAQYPIIHVAGTKGKGSVSTLCAAALQAAGYRVGLYTSPHLDDYAERIQVDGQNISHADLVQAVAELRPHIEAVERLTTFEITTALAFYYFARQGVNAAVIEVGLGGRLDATNICSPLVSVITSLSIDHTQLLGETLAEIAGEKAGIIKAGRPVVLAPQKEEARRVVERIAQERGCRLHAVGRDVLFAPLSYDLAGQTLQVWENDQGDDGHARQPVCLQIPLLGLHQVENAAVAYTALQAANAAGLAILPAQIAQGFSRASWPGRFELLRRDPPLVVDSAHNRDSALRLRQALDDYFPGRPVIWIFGASEDKDIHGMLAELAPRVEQVIAVKSFHPRAADPQWLAQMAQQHGKPTLVIPEVADALVEALRLAGSEQVILAAGSIFIAAAVRIEWQKILEQV